MANPTSAFGWQMPTSTDLVTDLPADFEVFGQAVDTSLADLKGGTTGQVLSKATNADMDFTWVTSDDANAIQNAIVDAKGDLIAASAADTPARLAVGANGETLVADSTASTGLKWAKSPNFVGASVFDTNAQNLLTATDTIITFGSENFDTDGFHDNVTNNSRLTIPTGLSGKYLLVVNQRFTTDSAGRRVCVMLKNGSQISSVEVAPYAAGQISISYSQIADAIAGDYFQVRLFQTSGSTLATGTTAATNSLQIQYLGA